MFKNSVFKSNVNFTKWLKASLVRALKTMAQVAGSMIVIGTFNETAWAVMFQTTLVSGLASILTSIAGIPEVSSDENIGEE